MDEPQEPTAQVNIHVDFNNLRAKLGSAVDRYVRLVSIGFQVSARPISEDTRMPGTGWSVSFSGTPPWSAQQAHEHYTFWLIAAGLRDVLEAFGAFLDECYSVASCIVLRRKHKETGELVGQDILDREQDLMKYNRLGVDKKIQKLKPWFESLPVDLRESVFSINRARNILVHHEGKVPDTYLDERGVFRISWRRLTMIAMGAAQREVRVGELLNAGEGLGILVVSEYRDFHRGDVVQLQPIEFSGVSWTVFTAGDLIREALEKEWTQL